MYNHIDDVKSVLDDDTSLGRLPCASHLRDALTKMEATLKEYYTKTSFPNVYGDAMILNPRCKFSIFETETWSDGDASDYKNGCRRRFIHNYESANGLNRVSNGRPTQQSNKRSTDNDDSEFQALLAQRSQKRQRNDYDRYTESSNDTGISPNYIQFGVVEVQCSSLS